MLSESSPFLELKFIAEPGKHSKPYTSDLSKSLLLKERLVWGY
jgi:hypothetical protein